MAHLIQQRQSLAVKASGIALILFLTACTNHQKNKSRQINGNENYLASPSLHPLKSSPEAILPEGSGTYDIPIVKENGALGKELDIRPPIQSLILKDDSCLVDSPTKALSESK